MPEIIQGGSDENVFVKINCSFLMSMSWLLGMEDIWIQLFV